MAATTAVRDRPGAVRRFGGYLRGRAHARLEILRVLPDAGWPLVATGIVLEVLAGALPIGFMVSTAAVVTRVPAAVAGGLTSPAWADLRQVLVYAAVLFTAQQLVAPSKTFVGQVVARRVDDRSYDRVMAASFRAGSLAPFEDQAVLDDLGDTVNLMKVADLTPGAACAGLLALISHYVQALGAAVVVGVMFSWWAAAVVAIGGLTLRFANRIGLEFFGRIWERHIRDRRRRIYFRDLMLREGGAKEIRVYGILDWLKGRHQQAAMESMQPIWQARRRIYYGPYVIYTVAAVAAGATSLGAAGSSAARGMLAVGSLVLVAQSCIATLRIGAYIEESDTKTQYGMLAHQALERFERLSAAAATVRPAGAVQDPAGLPRREIRLQGVRFTYPGSERPALRNLDLIIEAGRSLAIVGLNGAGKTTLVKLLARLYEPQQGTISADGIDVNDFEVGRWQRRFAAIFQDFIHFELSVRDNVGFGAVDLARQDAQDKRVLSVLERAGATALVRDLPHGLDTILSRQYAQGAQLSGGQWQRIAIARALMAVEAGASVLVLDEPTASLDVRAEVEFYERFLDLTRGLTSIIISHRFSTVRRADRIVVLADGEIVEDGTHDQLMAQGGEYARLFKLQTAQFAHEPEVATP